MKAKRVYPPYRPYSLKGTPHQPRSQGLFPSLGTRLTPHQLFLIILPLSKSHKHRKRTILLSRKRVDKGMKRMNSSTLSPKTRFSFLYLPSCAPCGRRVKNSHAILCHTFNSRGKPKHFSSSTRTSTQHAWHDYLRNIKK